ncbi:HAD family hydrolase [Aquipseudomonas ullengensis]|uniref:Haloacid dehalogenase superfamily, subfamily IA, variant 1 with third motif having Dx(3-4)D or Dx(3-4)E n=1 Tax=Aquipseudomonas ullengensis TaxID=2759166 RepID=A0A7W4QDC2_9GAMM|nr:HAD family hydrolase [Pseudomonas ullengensis]MBB2494403.1 hypothetical protein [Pseudomonas ullengensis]
MTQRYQAIVDAFREHLPHIKAVSFDVFDTLFLRTLHEPEALFDLLGLKLQVSDFRQQRSAAQHLGFQRMHHEGRHEICLEDIYSSMPHSLSSLAERGNLEQQLEHLVLRVNPEILALLDEARAAGKVVVLTSDMYLPESFFRALAERAGISIDHFLISSACNSTKRDSGELFVQLQQRLGMQPADILHVGDNPLGDVQRAEEKGLRSVHYQAPVFTAPQGRLDALGSINLGLSRYGTYCLEKSPWWQLGWQFGGPILQAFLHWIQQQARLDQVDRILFVSRDGYLMHQLHQSSPGKGLEASYLRGSRVSFTLASLTEQNFLKYVPFLMSGADNITLQDLFSRIGIDLPDEQVLGDLGLSSATPLTKNSAESIKQFLVAMRPSLLKAAQETRKGLYRHLLDLGLRDGMRIAFVDVGWSGTTQQAFQTACEGMFALELTGYYLGLSEHSSKLANSKKIKLRAFTESTGASHAQSQALYRNRAVAELFFSAPHPTTIGYRLSSGPTLQFIEDQERGIDYDISLIVEGINQGISDFAHQSEQLYKDLGQVVAYTGALDNLLQLLDRPSQEQVHLIGKIYNWDAWASSENHHTYFACTGSPSASNIKPDLWPAGWNTLRSSHYGL